jgi:hypothetical protein
MVTLGEAAYNGRAKPVRFEGAKAGRDKENTINKTIASSELRLKNLHLEDNFIRHQ